MRNSQRFNRVSAMASLKNRSAMRLVFLRVFQS
jgi:hypothetical protein